MGFFEDQTRGRIHQQDAYHQEGSDCSYYTKQPSPGQWVAVGIAAPGETAQLTAQMVVGTGRTEYAAIRALRRRCQRRSREQALLTK